MPIPAFRSSEPGCSVFGWGKCSRCCPEICSPIGACCPCTSGRSPSLSGPRMKILFLDQFSDLGGAQRCLLDLLPAVLERGWLAHVAAPGDGCLRPRAENLRSEERRVGKEGRSRWSPYH